MKKLLLFLIVPLILLPGCINFLNPLFEDEQVIFDPSLLGTWAKNEGESFDMMTFEKGENNTYRISLVITNVSEDTLGKQIKRIDSINFTGTLGKLGKYMYLDMMLANNTQCGGVNLINLSEYLIRSHIFAKVEKSDSLRLGNIDLDWLDKALENKKIKLGYSEYRTETERIPGEKPKPKYRKAITASTKELQKFIMKYAENENAFRSWMVLGKK